MAAIPTLVTTFTHPTNDVTIRITTAGVAGTPTLIYGIDYPNATPTMPTSQSFDSTAALNAAAARDIKALRDTGWKLVTA